MKYNSPYEIGVGDVVIMTDEDGYKTDHLVLVNYIIKVVFPIVLGILKKIYV